MDNIKISVITVVKNGMPFLKDAFNSYDNQTLEDKEHIVVYSNSKDETENFVKQFQNKKKIIKDNFSINKFGSINIGIKEAKGEIIGLLHADDVYPDNDTLNKVYKFYKNVDADIIYGDIKFCKKDNLKKIIRFWKSDHFSVEKLKFGWMPPHTSIYVKKKVIKENLYNTKYPISGDYEFILNLFLNNSLKKIYFKNVLCIMRSGGDSTKILGLLQKFEEDVQISKKFFSNFYFTIIFKILRKINQFFILR